MRRAVLFDLLVALDDRPADALPSWCIAEMLDGALTGRVIDGLHEDW